MDRGDGSLISDSPALVCPGLVNLTVPEVEAEWRPLEALEDVQVDRDRVRDDLVKEVLTELMRWTAVVKGPGAPRATPARGAAPRLGPPASSARLRGRA